MKLETFVTDSLWVAQIPLRTYGLEIGTRMTVCRLCSGDLWVHSPINPERELQQQLDLLGRVRFIIAPNRQHHFFIRDFIAAYPDALLFGSTDLPQKFPNLPFDGVLGEQPEPGWSDDLDQVPIRGNIFHDEVVFFHRHSRTLIVTDLCISGHPEQPPFTRFVLWLGGVYQKPGPLLDVKLAYLDKRAARASLEKVMTWDFERMILAHGHLVNSGAKQVFYRAYRFLFER
jgi:hypothetical protein